MENKTVIENAGLVLTAPFLPFFFRNLGYLDVMRFSSDETHAKAVYLLEYMATGDESTTGSLRLNALLCGWPPGRPLPPLPFLDEMEKLQADQILKSIVAHWTALGNVTVNDLRHRFIRRQAVLDESRLEARLHVEEKPHDVLLKELPWLYALTRTPWSDAIPVEWFG